PDIGTYRYRFSRPGAHDVRWSSRVAGSGYVGHCNVSCSDSPYRFLYLGIPGYDLRNSGYHLFCWVFSPPDGLSECLGVILRHTVDPHYRWNEFNMGWEHPE